MEELFTQSQALVSIVQTQFMRHLHQSIHWENRLIGIVGARGTGKSTLLLQRIKQHFSNSSEAIYLTLDDIYFTENRLVETIRSFHQRGVTHFFLDEVHKYPSWSREIKNLYDLNPLLNIVFTGSSMIDILKQEVDLSRRTVMYHLSGLSFREYLNFAEGTSFSAISLDDVFRHQQDATEIILKEIKPFQYFKEYLNYGYYPFFKENLPTYHHRLKKIVALIVESDLHFIEGISIENIRKIHQLLYILSAQVPFKPNISKLSERIGLHRNTLTQYLHYLEKAKLINMLGAGGKSIGTLQKPDKLFLDNTNLAFALAKEATNIGSLRETFFLNQLSNVSSITLAQKGDFLIDEKYTVEVGGAGKDNRQLKGVEQAYIAADDVERGAFNKIPLWLFGFLY